MHRFFVPPEWIRADQVNFYEETAHQIRHVLHLRPGEKVIVLDNLGMEFLVELVLVSNAHTYGRVLSQSPAQGEPQVNITLYPALTQREKFEWILQKCTELGMVACVPVLTTRSLVRSWKAEDERKVQRWQRILQEAAEQSHRGRIPHLGEVISLGQALQVAGFTHDVSIMPWEEERNTSLSSVLRGGKSEMPSREGQPLPSVGIFIGPEGGFTQQEAAQARQLGIHPISLGQRILRVETAAVTSVALVLYESGQMG